MANVKKRVDFYESEDGLRIKEILIEMTHSERYNTNSSYSANSAVHPDNLIPFVEKHMAFINTHPNVNADQYLSNLRLLTKLRV